MKIAITATEDNVSAMMDPRFGRCEWLAVYDNQTDQTTFYSNDAKEQQSGSGPKTAQRLADLGVNKVFSGDFGPKAQNALDALGIETVVLKDEQPLNQLIKNIKY